MDFKKFRAVIQVMNIFMVVISGEEKKEKCYVKNNLTNVSIVCIGALTPSKNTTFLIFAKPRLNLQIVQAPSFKQSSLCIDFSWTP